jgi:hypothetical protein
MGARGWLIAEMAAKRAGEILCGELLRRDLEPTAMKVMDGGGDVLVVLTIHKDWSKGFLIDRKQLSPEIVEQKLEVWKAKVRDDIATGEPSRPVRQAIARYGRAAVDQALAARAGHA